MKILMVAAEFSPYAKTGGLADAVSALSRELVGGGDDVRVLVPLHGCISERWRRDMRPLSSPIAVHLSEERWGRVHELIEP
ncbi:MAG: glycogen/starch synthase, partial [Puniceicoccales bacterium]|nr:glycogen/starch synthase [Puniceicoccales bacterium]